MVIGASWFLLGILVSEALSPRYTVTKMMSDLGVGATAPVFNVAIIGFGLLLLASALLLRSEGLNTAFLALLALAGAGAAGVGLFPETIAFPHAVCAVTAFLCGGFCALLASRLFPAPWSWFSLAFGLITLTALVLTGMKVYLGLSAGGMERMITYPLIIWAIGTGAYLMAPGFTGTKP
jgi:hypothetical membrane protein